MALLYCFSVLSQPSVPEAPVLARQAAPPAFVPTRSPAMTPSAAAGFGAPAGASPFHPASSGPGTPPQPAQPPPPPAPTGPPPNATVASVDTSQVQLSCWFLKLCTGWWRDGSMH